MQVTLTRDTTVLGYGWSTQAVTREGQVIPIPPEYAQEAGVLYVLKRKIARARKVLHGNFIEVLFFGDMPINKILAPVFVEKNGEKVVSDQYINLDVDNILRLLDAQGEVIALIQD